MSKTVDTVIEVGLDEIMGAAGLEENGERVLDLFETLVQANYSVDDRAWCLVNFFYEAVGFNPVTKLIQIHVTGEREDY